MNTLSKHLLAAAVLTTTAMTTTAVQAEGVDVSASVGASNFYLWRGTDLGDGSPQVWGDLSASYGGAYGGVWASSGDDALGNEYDIYAGYGGDLAGFSYDISVWNYNYPDRVTSTDSNGVTSTTTPTDFADLTDGVLSIGYGPVTYTTIKDITSGTTAYQSYDLALGDFTLTYGNHKASGTDDHFNVAYAYNDNLTVTVVVPVDADNGGDGDAENTMVNFGFTLAIE